LCLFRLDQGSPLTQTNESLPCVHSFRCWAMSRWFFRFSSRSLSSATRFIFISLFLYSFIYVCRASYSACACMYASIYVSFYILLLIRWWFSRFSSRSLFSGIRLMLFYSFVYSYIYIYVVLPLVIHVCMHPSIYPFIVCYLFAGGSLDSRLALYLREPGVCIYI